MMTGDRSGGGGLPAHLYQTDTLFGKGVTMAIVDMDNYGMQSLVKPHWLKTSAVQSSAHILEE